jgi:CheY-specific phosphatase CheX
MLETELRHFREAVIEVMQTMANLEVHSSKVFEKHAAGWPRADVSGNIGLVGDKVVGGFALLFPREAVLTIASNMLYEEFTDITGDVSDCVGELCNIVCGGVKKRFAEEMKIRFNLTQPTVIRGENHTQYHMVHHPVSVIPFDFEGKQFYLEAFLVDISGLESETEIRKRVSSIS